jgi:hypothetical protein
MKKAVMNAGRMVPRRRMNSGKLRVAQVIVLVIAEEGSFASMPSAVGVRSFLAMLL